MASGHVVVIRLLYTCIIRVDGIFGCERLDASGMMNQAQVVFCLLCEEVGSTERISLPHMSSIDTTAVTSKPQATMAATNSSLRRLA